MMSGSCFLLHIGEFSSELVSTYLLNDASRSPEQRLSDLLQLAIPQTIELRKKAQALVSALSEK